MFDYDIYLYDTCVFEKTLSKYIMLLTLMCVFLIQEDLFVVAARHVGKMKKIKIGHDRSQLSKSRVCWSFNSIEIKFLKGYLSFNKQTVRNKTYIQNLWWTISCWKSFVCDLSLKLTFCNLKLDVYQTVIRFVSFFILCRLCLVPGKCDDIWHERQENLRLSMWAVVVWSGWWS